MRSYSLGSTPVLPPYIPIPAPEQVSNNTTFRSQACPSPPPSCIRPSIADSHIVACSRPSCHLALRPIHHQTGRWKPISDKNTHVADRSASAAEGQRIISLFYIDFYNRYQHQPWHLRLAGACQDRMESTLRNQDATGANISHTILPFHLRRQPLSNARFGRWISSRLYVYITSCYSCLEDEVAPPPPAINQVTSR